VLANALGWRAVIVIDGIALPCGVKHGGMSVDICFFM